MSIAGKGGFGAIHSHLLLFAERWRKYNYVKLTPGLLVDLQSSQLKDLAYDFSDSLTPCGTLSRDLDYPILAGAIRHYASLDHFRKILCWHYLKRHFRCRKLPVYRRERALDSPQPRCRYGQSIMEAPPEQTSLLQSSHSSSVFPSLIHRRQRPVPYQFQSRYVSFQLP